MVIKKKVGFVSYWPAAKYQNSCRADNFQTLITKCHMELLFLITKKITFSNLRRNTAYNKNRYFRGLRW